MRKLQLTESARKDLKDIWRYIALEQASPEAADGLIDELAEQIKWVIRFPMSGEAVDSLRVNARRIVVNKRYFVFYQPSPTEILVLRVMHTAQLIRPDDVSG